MMNSVTLPISGYPLMSQMLDCEQQARFNKLKTSRERIEFVLKTVRPFNRLIVEFNEKVDINRSYHGKNADKSLEFKNKGIHLFQSKCYKNAISMFIKAILSAPFDSGKDSVNRLYESYAYKCWAEIHLNDFSSALSSVNYCLEFLESKEMFLLKIDCLEQLARYPEALQTIEQLIQRYDTKDVPFETFIDMKYDIYKNLYDSPKLGVNPSDVGAVDSLKQFGINVWLHPSCELRCTQRKGIHGVAKQLIPKNTVVLLERPSNVALSQPKLKTVCNKCYKNLGTSFWPCIGCDELVFCDKHCFSEAFETYHKYECGLLDLLYRMGTTYVHTFRMISRVGIQKAFECEEQNNFDFDTYLESKRQKVQIYSNDGSEDDTQFETEFEAYSSLVNNHSKQDFHLIKISLAIEAALLFNYTKQLDFNIEENFEEFVAFADICLQNNERVQNNMFGWILNPNIKQIQREYMGNCVCTISALLNHSCSPNIFWGFDGSQMKFTAKTDIKAGEEICVTYGPQTTFTPFLQRQLKLRYQYFFDCDCEGCLQDSKTILCIRCDQCSGPVVPIKMHTDMQRDVHCLKCGHKYENLDKSMAEISSLKERLDSLLNQLTEQNVGDFDYFLRESVKLMESLICCVSKESKPISAYVMKVIRACVRHNRFVEAVLCFEYFGTAIENLLSNCILSDLHLLTTSYYMYFHENEVLNTKQWDNCFELYSKLIFGLKKKKKAFKARDVREHPIEGLTQDIREKIKEKKNEFRQLRQNYESLFVQM